MHGTLDNLAHGFPGECELFCALKRPNRAIRPSDSAPIARYNRLFLEDLKYFRTSTIYADPLLGVGQGIRESLLLRRVSQATFPFLVSEDSTFNPRTMGIRTPQVALVESQVITQVFDVLAELRSLVVQ